MKSLVRTSCPGSAVPPAPLDVEKDCQHFDVDCQVDDESRNHTLLLGLIIVLIVRLVVGFLTNKLEQRDPRVR